MNRIIPIALAILLGGFTTASAADTPIKYPEGYRSWTHVKSMVLHENHPLAAPFKGIHHVYANEKAFAGLNDGQYKDGATFAFDLLEYVSKDNASVEGPRVLLGVMVKDQARYQSTGGWGFEGFAGNSRQQRLVKDGGVSCFACHTSQKNQDFVFSRLRN